MRIGWPDWSSRQSRRLGHAVGGPVGGTALFAAAALRDPLIDPAGAMGAFEDSEGGSCSSTQPAAAAGREATFGQPPAPAAPAWPGRFVAGGQRATILTLSTTAFGAGIFTVPFAFKLSGAGLGLVLLALCCTSSWLSLTILTDALQRHDAKSYSELASRAVHPVAGIGVDLIVLVNGASIGAILFMFFADFASSTLFSIWPGAPEFLPHEFWRLALIFGGALLSLPLAVARNYGKLRAFTVAYVAVILATAAVVVSEMPARFRAASLGTVAPWRWSWGLCQAFNIYLFAFMQHQNAIPIVRQMTDSAKDNASRVLGITAALEAVVYATLGLAGYFSFLDDTREDFILNYPTGDIPMLVCRIAMSLCLLFAIPMTMIATAGSFRQLLKHLVKGVLAEQESHPPPPPAAACEEVRPVGSAAVAPTVFNLVIRRPVLAVWRLGGRRRRICSVAVLVALDVAVAVSTNQVGLGVSLIGGMLATVLMSLLPALIYKGSGTHADWKRHAIFGALIATFITGVSSSFATVYLTRWRLPAPAQPNAG